jgi:arylsulfatase A-like enzyme
MSGIFNKKSIYNIGSMMALFIIVLFVLVFKPGGIFSPPGTPSGKPGIVDSLKDYNLIIINIDSLRAGHLGCYGYHRNTSPFIDTLAREGMVFAGMTTNSSFTRESVAVLLTGRLPSSGDSVGWRAQPSRGIKNIGELFQEAGYKTAFLTNTSVLNDPGFTAGFLDTHHLKEWGVSGAGPKLSKRAGQFIVKNKDRKFMIYLHYLDPHGPYQPPPEYYLRFTAAPYPDPLSLYKYVRNNCAALIKEGFGPGEARYEDMVLRYDAEIAHTDHSIGILFNKLEEHGLQDRTFVVITADHGEEFLEHDFVEHSWTLYNESLQIPLVLWAPGVVTPKRIDTRVSTVDILPTILELMKIPHQRNDFDGTPLFRSKNKGFYFIPPAKPCIAELLIQHRNLIRVVIKEDWKYIAAIRWLPPQKRPEVLFNVAEFEGDPTRHLDTWGPVVHEELYHLSTDPLRNAISSI